MLKLISAHFVRDEAHCIEMMFDSLQPYVDESYVMVDDRTTDNTKSICLDRGCKVIDFSFQNFGKTWNTLLNWVSGKSDWTICIAPDETINKDFGEMLHPLIDKVNDQVTDVIGFPRRHWEDLEMKVEYTKQNWYPDHQYRLLRNDFPRIHLINYVHEWIKGDRHRLVVREKDINHFNMYWKPRIAYNFDEMNVLYRTLAEKQKQDGGIDIWP